MSEAKRRMLSKNFGVASFKYNRWSAELEEDQELEDALQPTFWAELVGQLIGYDKNNPRGRGDIIEVRKRSTAMFAELIVTETGPGYIRVELLRKAEPPVVEIPEDNPFTTRWNVGRQVHEVIRKSDKFVMAGGFQTKAKAAEWITDHMKAIAA